MNPFYKIFLWGYMTISKPCKKGGKTPKWDQTINIKFNENSLNSDLKLEIWDEKNLGDNDIIGSGLLKLDEIFDKKKFPQQWIDIFTDEVKVGRVLLNIEWKNN